MLPPAVRRFEVLFTKDGSKKRKVYNDGSLQILLKPSASNPPQSTSSSSPATTHGHGSYSVILSDDNGKELFRKTLTEDQIKDFLPSNEITLNQYLVQIEKETDKIASVAEITSQQEIEEAKTPMNLLNTKKFLPKFPSKRLMSSKPNTVNTVASVAQQPMKLQIDASLLRVMREHQVEAADFIMNCFQSPPQEQDRDEDDDDFLIPRKHQPGTELMRGAILADDMGLGKTLTAISVLWTYIKGGKCKGLVICPSSLVENWEKEIRKWMGVRLKPLSLRSGPQAVGTVNTFRVGHPSMTPVLILSYEMFRKHSAALNATPLLDIIICDEAHRLKNVTGTKTMTALSSCKATKRLVLTGTPIQNRLSELYAILQFVCPDTSQIGLGSLSSFKHLISDPIDRLNRAQSSGEKCAHPALVEGAERAKEKLNRMLQRVMIRRSREEILRKLLPPRREYILKCSLTAHQMELYQQVADVMKNEWEKDIGRDMSGYLLPGLQKLRQICNYATEDSVPHFEDRDPRVTESNAEPETEEFYYEEELPKKRKGESVSSALPKKSKKTKAGTQALIGDSTKLQILEGLVQTVQERRSLNPNGDYGKIVVVSNFTSMLDAIESLAIIREWPTLRLDGSVLSEKRLSLVDRFNRSSDPSLVFLLSSKAGGVGLNLIGANRLVMVDCDWNPSIDAQAMARVWREGQQRPVYVYRMITADRIEEAIYQRQRVKEGLHSVISLDDGKSSSVVKEVEPEQQQDAEDAEEELPESDPEEVLVVGEGDLQEEVVSPWLADIWSLVWPTPSDAMAPPLPASASASCGGYEDELLDFITSGPCRQSLLEVIQIPP